MIRRRMLAARAKTGQNKWLGLEFADGAEQLYFTLNIESAYTCKVIVEETGEEVDRYSLTSTSQTFRLLPTSDVLHIQIKVLDREGNEIAFPYAQQGWANTILNLRYCYVSELPARACDLFSIPYYGFFSFSAAFSVSNASAAKLTRIPDAFFEGQSVSNLEFTFQNQANLTGKVPLIDGKKPWDASLGISGISCFKGCTMLDEYNEIPDNWK